MIKWVNEKCSALTYVVKVLEYMTPFGCVCACSAFFTLNKYRNIKDFSWIEIFVRVQ